MPPCRSASPPPTIISQELDMNQLADDAPDHTSKSSERRETAAASVGADQDSSVTGRSVTINRPRAELYAYWRDFREPRDASWRMSSGSTRSTTDALALGGEGARRHDRRMGRVDHRGDARTSSSPGRPSDGADVANSGRIEFRDAGARGTVVTATIALRSARRRRRQADRQDVPARARDPGAARPAPLQAADGNRRDRAPPR